MGGKRFYLNVEFFPPSCWFLYAKEEFGGSLRAVSVWSERWLPAAAWRLLWSRSVSLSVEVVLRYVRRTTDWGLFPSTLSHAHRRKQEKKKGGCFLKARVRSRRSEHVWFLSIKFFFFNFCADVLKSLSETHPLPPPGFAHFVEVTQHSFRVNYKVEQLRLTRCSLDTSERCFL